MKNLVRRGRQAGKQRGRELRMEPLEARLPLSAAGLIDVGAQPSGSLDGKIVYLHGGHGYTADNLDDGAWSTQRPLLLGMVEDMGNQDQMTFLAQYLFDAGATVAALRPIGHQPNEVVLDNDDVEVTFAGAWSDSSASIYFGDAGDVPYRYASTSATETATARYTPNIPESGFYPVYSWTRYGSDRAADQLYKVHHSGGVTEVTVNHRRVGNGTVYLGTYYFEAGSDGYVEISNESSESGRVVIADMIRFGNGVGDIDRGGGVSGYDREDEAALYWIQWHVDRSQGVSDSEYRTSSSDRTATISASPRYAEYMNREADGSLSDRLFVSFHSNAGGGRGAVGLHNTSNGGATPNQQFLAATLGASVNLDMQAQNGRYEHNWSTRTSHTFQASFNYGEINNSSINNEFDATIVETAFHDSQQDAELMRDPDVRQAIARATYQGIVEYFNTVDSGATPLLDAPSQPQDVRVETTASGEVTVHWSAGAANSYAGDAAAGFTVYASANGYGYDGGRYVAGGGATSLVISGLDPSQTYYFKVAANNAAGQSPATEVVAATPSAGQQRVLIVNGFDRLDRSMNPTQTFFQGGQLERVRPRQSNSFDYAVQMASAIQAAAPGTTIDTTANELVISGGVDLSDYDSVYWILGEESSDDQTFDAAEQSAVASYLTGGGRLFVSGSEIGWDLDALDNGRDFYNQTLRADYASDDAGTYSAAGVSGSIFEGLSLNFDDGDQFYDVNFPDVITPQGGATSALSYGNGAGSAGLQYADDDQRLVMLAFPFETITSEADRNAVMQRVIEFFNDEFVPTVTIEQVLDNDAGAPYYTTTGDWTDVASGGYDGGGYQTNTVGAQAQATWTASLPIAGTAEVYVQYTAGGDRTGAARFQVSADGQTVNKFVNQTADDLQWVLLTTLDVTPGELTVVLNAANSAGSTSSLVVADTVRVVLTGKGIESGDFNHDGTVDAADYTVYRSLKGQSVPQGYGADANFDGVVDAADGLIWRDQYGTTVEVAPAPTAAPLAASAPIASNAAGEEPTSAEQTFNNAALAAAGVGDSATAAIIGPPRRPVSQNGSPAASEQQDDRLSLYLARLGDRDADERPADSLGQADRHHDSVDAAFGQGDWLAEFSLRRSSAPTRR